MGSVLTILLACIGTWGMNCQNNCTFGFFGLGCRQKCECSIEQVCERRHGCIDINTTESKFHDFNRYKLVYKCLLKSRIFDELTLKFAFLGTL